ncbi:MAG TPA: hypothetical protein VN577_11865 [Terriglobales bacterium]|nr:hypothetical protein [Terriglobales bacterium]
MTKFPRKGTTASYWSLAVVGFLLLMVLIYLFLRRTPPAQSQPDRPQSGAVVWQQPSARS